MAVTGAPELLIVMGATDAQLELRASAGVRTIAENASAADIAGYFALVPSVQVTTAWLGT